MASLWLMPFIITLVPFNPLISVDLQIHFYLCCSAQLPLSAPISHVAEELSSEQFACGDELGLHPLRPTGSIRLGSRVRLFPLPDVHMSCIQPPKKAQTDARLRKQESCKNSLLAT